jgi:hypothetical protein
MEGGAIHPKSLQSMRPARMWETALARAAQAEIPMFAPAPAAGLVAASTTTGSLMFPRTRPTRLPEQRSREAPKADNDEDQGVQPLEYPA